MPVREPEVRDYTVDGKLAPLGYEQITDVSSVQELKRPTGARVAKIQALTQDVRWRDDGTDPSSTVGMVLAAGTDMLYTGDLLKIKFFEAAASAELNITYYF